MLLQLIVGVVVSLAGRGRRVRARGRTRLRPERQVRVTCRRGRELLGQERLEANLLDVRDVAGARTEGRLLEEAHDIRLGGADEAGVGLVEAPIDVPDVNAELAARILREGEIGGRSVDTAQAKDPVEPVVGCAPASVRV